MVTEAEAIDLQHELNQEQIRRFIRQNGGVITFDQFVEESLYGKANSFYQEKVTIGKKEDGGHFLTDGMNPLFAQLCHRFIQPYLDKYGGDMMELGGGNGRFKRNFLDRVSESQKKLRRYISVDASQKCHREQSQYGGVNLNESALSMSLPDRSVNGVVFSNELVDALPFKLVGPNIEDHRFTGMSELMYRLDSNNEIYAEWVQTTSPEITRYMARQQRFLQSVGFHPDWDYNKHLYFGLNLNEEKLLVEINRVLNHGTIMLVDYGATIHELIEAGGFDRFDMFPHRLATSAEQAYHRAYEADLTYKVNFTNLQEVARELGLTVVFYGPQKYFLWDLISKEEESELDRLGKNHPWYEDRQTIQRDTSPGSFKVLVLEKK